MSCNSSFQTSTVTDTVFDLDGITSSWPQKLTNVTSLQDNCSQTFIELLQLSFTMYLFTVFTAFYVIPTYSVTFWPTVQ